MYILISTADNVATIFTMIQYLVLTLIREDLLTDIRLIGWLTMISVTATGVFWRISVFSNVLLSVARTIKINRPFQAIKKKLCFLFIVGCGIFWAALGTADIYVLIRAGSAEFFDNYMDFPRIGLETAEKIFHAAAKSNRCDPDNEDCGSMEMLHRGIVLLLFVIAYLLPVVVVLICMGIQIWWITKPRGDMETTAGPDNRRHVTVTILQLTVLFFVCHTAASIWYLCTDFFKVSDHHIIRAIIYITLPLVNAAISPIIIVARSKHLRRDFTRRFSRTVSTISVRRPTLHQTETFSMNTTDNDKS
jgi:hypothetical protein